MESLPEPLRRVLRAALHLDVRERLSAAQFARRLQAAARPTSADLSSVALVPAPPSRRRKGCRPERGRETYG
jgi:hypothetical protein